MDMTPGSKHNDEHDEAQKKVFRGYGFRPEAKTNPPKKTLTKTLMDCWRPLRKPETFIFVHFPAPPGFYHQILTNKKNIRNSEIPMIPMIPTAPIRRKNFWCLRFGHQLGHVAQDLRLRLRQMLLLTLGRSR